MFYSKGQVVSWLAYKENTPQIKDFTEKYMTQNQSISQSNGKLGFVYILPLLMKNITIGILLCSFSESLTHICSFLVGIVWSLVSKALGFNPTSAIIHQKALAELFDHFKLSLLVKLKYEY